MVDGLDLHLGRHRDEVGAERAGHLDDDHVPLTFLSNAFVPAGSWPAWLRAFVNINPVSHVVTAARDLMNNGSVTGQVGWAILGCAAVIAIFAPLSVRSYRRKL